MKKIFSAIMAVAALAACNKSEVLETPKGAAIAFDNVYVENATKAADLNKDNIQNFGYSVTLKQTRQVVRFSTTSLFRRMAAHSHIALYSIG